jgi:hypothetical protein
MPGRFDAPPLPDLLTWLGDELITVPDFPAWVCDVCGRREYDLQALNQLNLLLNRMLEKARHASTAPRAPSHQRKAPARAALNSKDDSLGARRPDRQDRACRRKTGLYKGKCPQE